MCRGMITGSKEEKWVSGKAEMTRRIWRGKAKLESVEMEQELIRWANTDNVGGDAFIRNDNKTRAIGRSSSKKNTGKHFMKRGNDAEP